MTRAVKKHRGGWLRVAAGGAHTRGAPDHPRSREVQIMAKDLKAGQRVLNRFTGALGRVTQAYEFEGRKLVEVLYDGQDTPNTGVMAAFARVKHADLIDGYATGVLRRLGNLADLTRDLRAAGTLDDWSAGRILDAVRDAVKGVHDRASGTSYESGR